MSLESDLQAALLLEAPNRLHHVRLFRRNVGTVRIGRRVIRFGIAGQSDLYAIVRVGQHIEVELKAAGGRLTPDQTRWRAFCAEWEVPWITLQAKSLETADQTIARWLDELAAIVEKAES